MMSSEITPVDWLVAAHALADEETGTMVMEETVEPPRPQPCVITVSVLPVESFRAISHNMLQFRQKRNI